MGINLIAIVNEFDNNLNLKMAKGKKGGNTNKAAHEKPIVTEANVIKKADTSKEEEMNRIMAGINTMDLDN